MKTNKKVPQFDDSGEDLREQFITACRAVTASTTTLALLAQQAVDEGVERDTLVTWAMDAGWSLSHAKNTIGQLFRDAGKRQRKASNKPRAGTETAREILALVRKGFPALDDIALASELLAASRLVKRQAAQASVESDPADKLVSIAA